MKVRGPSALMAAAAAALLSACAPLTMSQRGAWQQVAAAPQGFFAAWAFALTDDRVLAFGSQGAAFYDPTTNTWRQGAKIPAGFAPGIAAALPDGRLFVTFRGSAGPADTRALLYDPDHDRWLVVPPMTDPREGESVTVLRNGSVLVAGGYGPTGPSSPIGNAEQYDPARKLWSPAGHLIVPRSGHVATLLADGRVFIVGGSDVNQTQAQLTEIYDPSHNTWTDGGRLMIPSQAPQVIALRDGRVLEIAGFDLVGSPIPVSELYEPRSRSWQIGPSIPSPGGGRLASMADGRVLLVKASLNPANAVFRAEIFDPQKMTWAASPIVRGEPGATVTLHDGRLITVGPTASWIYDSNAVPPAAPGESGIGSPQTTLVLGGIAGILVVLVLIQYLFAQVVERRRIKLV
jgi:hypothetical protein